MIIIIGCCKHTTGHINPKAGIFGVLEERMRKVRLGIIIPAHNNTDCAHRRTKQCNIYCPRARYGILSGGKISYRRIGKRM